MAVLVSLRSNIQFFTIAIFVINCYHFAVASNRQLYTREENQALDKFRPVVEKYLTLDYHKSDAYLLRWLRNNGLVLSTAEEELKNNFQWRQKNKIDSILDENEEIPKDLPYLVDGVDKGGRPIAIHPFGKWNIRKYVVAGKQHLMVRQYQRMYEHSVRKAFEASERLGKDIDQIAAIADLQGYNFREHACARCLSVTIDMARSFGSGFFHFARNATLVNTPRIFQPVLSLARAIITQVPLKDYDNNKEIWQKELLEEINPDQLPKFLGGNRN